MLDRPSRIAALAWIVLLLLWVPVSADDDGGGDLWLAVGPPELTKSLEPLVNHRAKQGMRVAVASPPLAAALDKHKPTYLLIVGDEKRMPPQGLAFYRWRKVQPQTFASDAHGVDAAVGRVPAATAEQVAVFVRKVIAYENRTLGPEDLRMPIWAGAPGYGGVVDTMATRVLVSTVQANAPSWSEPWFISADVNQDLCGVPADQPRVFCESVARGSYLSAFAAHASADAVFSMRAGKKGIWFHTGHARAFWKDATPKSPMVFLSCNCGEFDRDRASIAENLLFWPGGPVATIGATTESHPLPNFFTGVCMMKAASGKYGRLDRLGSMWREAQKRALTERNPMMEGMLRNVEGKLEDTIDEAKLRRDQQRLYVLLGDPATRLPAPESLAVAVEGDTWNVTPPNGATHLFVEWRPRRAPKASSDDPHARFVAANAAFAYVRLAKIAADKPWQGAVKGDGAMRFTATGPGGRIWVFVKPR